MPNPLKDKTEDEIIQQLFVGVTVHAPQTPVDQIAAEMQRRLILAIRDFNAASGKQAGRMIALTWAIVALTVALGAIAAIQLWVMLKGGA